MKIRYYHKDNPGKRWTTKEFNAGGTPTGKYRLAIEKDAKAITGNALIAELQKPLYPDVPFGIRLPLVRTPKSHFEWVYIEDEQENGTIVMKKEWTEVWDVTRGEYNASLEMFENHLRQYLKIAEIYSLPDIPDDDGYIWEEVDMTKPYRERFTKIPVEKGKYNGDFCKITQRDELFAYFAKSYGQSKNPVVKMVKRIV